MPVNDHLLQQIRKFRHRLHELAELSGEEQQTASAVQEFIKKTAPDEMQTDVGGHGILATYIGKSEGTHVLIRCELDALPIEEEQALSYNSHNEGVAHKCGHDGHMAIVCGVAKWLQQNRPESGKVTLLFQPAEETGVGAQQVLQSNAFKKIDPNYCFALHNLPGYPRDQIVTREGIFAAASVGMVVRLRGTTSHAAHPEEGKSPAPAVAQLIQSFSAIPQYFSSLDESVKVTVVHAEIGERAFGTSPGSAVIMTTLRTYSTEILERLKNRCEKLVKGMAETYELEIDYEWAEEFSATVNHFESVQRIKKAADRLELNVCEKPAPFSWSEDFSHFTAAMKGAMFGLGAGKKHPSLHAGTYDFPDEILSTGIEMFTEIIEEFTHTNE